MPLAEVVPGTCHRMRPVSTASAAADPSRPTTYTALPSTAGAPVSGASRRCRQTMAPEPASNATNSPKPVVANTRPACTARPPPDTSPPRSKPAVRSTLHCTAPDVETAVSLVPESIANTRPFETTGEAETRCRFELPDPMFTLHTRAGLADRLALGAVWRALPPRCDHSPNDCAAPTAMETAVFIGASAGATGLGWPSMATDASSGARTGNRSPSRMTSFSQAASRLHSTSPAATPLIDILPAILTASASTIACRSRGGPKAVCPR